MTQRFIPQRLAALFAFLALCLAGTSFAAQTWTQGKHYVLVAPIQQTKVAAGKVEVLEVFSYGCPACNGFEPVMKKIQASLPPNAQVAHLPASFIPTEGWPMFQRAYFAAQALGIADKTHSAMYEAIWLPGGELAIMDATGRRVKSPLPSIEDAAKFYEKKAGVKAADFLATAKSFSIESKMRAADAQILKMKVSGTPTLVVNGKYRINNDEVGGVDNLIALVGYLVAKESGATAAPATAVTKPVPAPAPAAAAR